MRKPLILADLPDDAARFAEEQIGAGHFASVDAFVSAAALALQERLAILRAAIDEGDSSGVAEGGSFARVRAQLGLTSR